ncbi:MAG: hypothetical protein HFF84_09725 [Oscillibacter sp.]|nr:hypothetical protein [Oscillibacter sp.]
MKAPIAILIVVVFLCIIGAILYRAFGRRKPPKQKSSKQSFDPFDDPAPTKKSIMESIDEMDGFQFEQFCANLLEHFGYQKIHITRSTGDQGVDIIAIKNGIRYAFQCKRYASKIGNSAVQEVNTGRALYSCQVGVVITNNYFTTGAKQAAKANGVELWDRDVLMDKIARILH